MTRQHGITADSYKKLILDAGAVYTGFTSFASPGTLIGATKGGSQFTIEQEIKMIEVDGARGPVKEGRRITDVKVALTINFIEHTLTNLQRALVGSESAVDTVNWDVITRADFAIAAADYIDDITLIGELSGTTDPMAIQINNAIVDSNFDLSFTDKEEGVIAMTFTGHFDPALLGADNDLEPWKIYWPNT